MSARIFLLFVALGVASAALPPGRPLPDYPVLLPNNKRLDLKQYRGKPVLLVIFSTTCKDCEEAVNLLDKMQPQWAARGLQMVLADVEPEAAQMVGIWIPRNRKRYPVGYLDLVPYQKITAVKPDQVAHVPIFLFIDPKSYVRLQFYGDDPLLKNNMGRTINNVVQELLKEPRQAPAAAQR